MLIGTSTRPKSAWRRYATPGTRFRLDTIAARRVVVDLNTGIRLAFPTQLAEGLPGASPKDLAEIEISPAGLGLHWPALDADVYVPALLQGVFGSPSWMAKLLGARGGIVRSKAKAAAARANGRKGGRPRKTAAR